MLISDAYQMFDMYYLVEKGRSEKTRIEYYRHICGKYGLINITGDINVEHIGKDHILRWKLILRDGHIPSYVNDHLSTLRVFLKWLRSLDYHVLDWRDIEFDTVDTGKPKPVLDPDEIARLTNAAPRLRDKAIVQLLFGSAVRVAELISLDRRQWEAIELKNKDMVATGKQVPVWEFYVYSQKIRKYRPVVIYQEVKDYVDAYLGTRTDGFEPLFISDQNRRVSYSLINAMLHSASRRAGLEKRVTPHILRHSHVTYNAAKGMPIPIISRQLGHTNPAITMRIYTHINSHHTADAYAEYHRHLAKGNYIQSYPTVKRGLGFVNKPLN